MTIGHLHYERGHYSAVEHLFLQTSALCSEHLVWRTNVAHTFFVQEKYEDAIGYYADIVKHYDGYLLDVTPVILANLCVSYIVTNQVSITLPSASKRHRVGVVDNFGRGHHATSRGTGS